MTMGYLQATIMDRFASLLLLLLISLQTLNAATPWDAIVPNDALQFPDEPKWLNYATKDRFPDLRFREPIQVVFQSSYDQGFFVVEKPGKIQFVPDRNQPKAQVFLDISEQVYNYSESGLLALAFHPNFEKNGRLFVHYTAKERVDESWQYFNRLSEFNIDPNNFQRALNESERILINQPDRHQDHNGGGMLFGPDGYLYLTIGDEGQFYDLFGNSQKLTNNFFAGMFRIDVDRKPGSLPPNAHPASSEWYTIPPDNPFVGAESYRGQPLDTTKVRTEFYAIGMRNAWRFAFDPLTNKLYSGDTGDHTREEINEIISGGNYGWPHREGSLPGPPRHAIKRGNHGFMNPIAEYGREDGNDVAGMVVYRGTKFPELNGHLIFSDFFSGWLGKLKLGENSSSHIEWFAWDFHIADLVVDPVDENILLVDMYEGKIKQFVPPSENNFEDIPELLSETGAFLDTKSFTIDPSFIYYDINVPFWSDYAIKTRWISFSKRKTAMHYRENDTWGFPPGTVFMKHFDMEMRRGDPSTKRRLETRFLYMTSNGVFYGLVYRWNEAQDDAVLVPPSGLKETLNIEVNGLEREQEWYYPGRHDCMACHNGGPSFLSADRSRRYALAFNTSQLNMEVQHGQTSFNQLHAMNQAGLLSPPLGKPAKVLPKLAALDDENASLNYRARSYLAANCESCHEGINGIARLHWNATFRATNEETKLIEQYAYNDLAITGGRLIRKFDPVKSVLLQRISRNNILRMPPLGSSELDHEAIELIKRWILEGFEEPQSYSEWAIRHFGDVNHSDAIFFADPDGDGITNLFEALTLTNPLDKEDYFKMHLTKSKDSMKLVIPGVTNRYVEVEWTETPNDSASWKSLDLPENTFFFPASAEERSIDLESIDQDKAFFRARVREL